MLYSNKVRQESVNSVSITPTKGISSSSDGSIQLIVQVTSIIIHHYRIMLFHHNHYHHYHCHDHHHHYHHNLFISNKSGKHSFFTNTLLFYFIFLCVLIYCWHFFPQLYHFFPIMLCNINIEIIFIIITTIHRNLFFVKYNTKHL